MNSHPIFARALAVTLVMALLPGCATARAARAGGYGGGAPQNVDRTVMAEYVQKLPLGTVVRVDRASGKSIKGTLMKATAAIVVVQPRTRVPEPPVEIALTDVVRIAPESNGGSIAKAIGAGAAAGAGAALGVFLILLAVFSD